MIALAEFQRRQARAKVSRIVRACMYVGDLPPSGPRGAGRLSSSAGAGRG
jgi:hypothetical protein